LSTHHNLGHGYSSLGHGGYGHGIGLGFHLGSGIGHHVYYPHYDTYGGYYAGVYPYSYYDAGLYSSAPASVYVAGSSQTPQSYSVAKPAIPDAASATASSNSPSDESYRLSAEAAFRAGQFGQAAKLVSHALVEDPENVQLQLLLAHALFASSDYRGSALTIHRAASIGGLSELGYHVKNWRNLYRDGSYTEAMNRLNKFVAENPDDAAARFVRGYHFLYLDNHADYAKRELSKALELEPGDRLASDLIARLDGDPIGPPTLDAEPLESASSATPAVDDHSTHTHP